jgi:1-acyl-sn-glycerol-3-phosphate acyltransferase
VPTFAAGALATLAGAVLRWRGAGRADSAVTDRIKRWSAWVWLRAGGARVTADGLEHLSTAGPCLVVSNHRSLPDPMVYLHALPVSLRVLAMRELFRIPLFGAAMRAIGMIEVDRESSDFGEIDTEAAWDLAAGHSLLVYPKGKISPDGAIRKVSKTAPSPSRPPIRCRSRRSPSTAPAGSGRRGEAQSMPVRRARLPEARCRPAA